MNSGPEPAVVRTYGRLWVGIFDRDLDMGARAAADFAAAVRQAVDARGFASVILATGNSQLPFMAALRQRDDIPWDKVLVFHMDEYRGMPETDPASFRRYIREQLTDHVHPRQFFGLQGDAPDTAAEIRRYTELLKQYPADVCVMGIGENGHLAFNDPPADFETTETVHVVNLDLACRRQQVGEGHFATIDDVPMQALSLTVPALLAAKRVLVVVPERRKAAAVKAALQGPVTPSCPASILQTQPHARLYLDRESSSLLGI